MGEKFIILLRWRDKAVNVKLNFSKFVNTLNAY